MLSFFNKSFDQQVKTAIDLDDSKLLQVLLGPKYLQLWQYWMVHATLSYNTLATVKVIEYQLPIDVIHAYRSILTEKFPYSNSNPDQVVPKEKINEVNEALKCGQIKTFQRYNIKYLSAIDGHGAQMISIPLFYDAIREVDYAMYSNIDEYSERETDIKSFVDKFNNNPAFITVLKLDFTTQCQNMIKEVQKQYQFQVAEKSKISHAMNELIRCYQTIQPYDEKLEGILDQIRRDILGKIRDKKFVNEMYEELLSHLLNAIKEEPNHPLYKDLENTNIESIIRKNNADYNVNLLNNFLEYAAGKHNPNLNIIGILLINGASLLAAQVYNAKEQVSQSVSQYFIKSQNPSLESLSSSSIYTVMKDVHNVLFDFPIIRGDIDCSKVLSVIPSRFAEFNNNVKEKSIFTKVGEKGERELMELLDRYKALIKDKEQGEDNRNAMIKLWSSFCNKLGKVSANDRLDKNYTLIYQKLDECINVGYLAIATGDDKVILDYAMKIKREHKCEKDSDIKKLYDIFLTILYENRDLVKLPWWGWESVCYKTKHFVQWKVSWDKILTTPELDNNRKYDTRASEWSHGNFVIIHDKRTKSKSKALERKDHVIQQQDQVLQEQSQIIQKQNLEKQVMKIFLKKTLSLVKKLRDVVHESDDKVVEKVAEYVQKHNKPSEQVIDAVIEEIKLHKNQIIARGRIDSYIIESGIESFSARSRLESINVSQVVENSGVYMGA